MTRGDKKKGGGRRPPRKPKKPRSVDLASLPIGGEIDLKKPEPRRSSRKKGHPDKLPSRIEMDRRVRSVEERLRDGLTDTEVRNELQSRCIEGCPDGCNKHPDGRHIRGCPADCRRHLGIGQRQAENYVARAYARLRELAKPEEMQHRDQIIAMLHRAYQGCMAIGDYSGAANVAMKIARIKNIIDADPTINNVMQVLAGLPTDRDRFSGDRNYQLMAVLRDALAQAGARGNLKAAAAAATISSGMVETFGYSAGGMGETEEAELAERVRGKIITVSKFGDEPMDPIEAFDEHGHRVPAVNDFADQQVEAKKKTDR